MSLKSSLETFFRRQVVARFGKLSRFETMKFMDEVCATLCREADARELDSSDRHYLLYRIQRALLPEFVIADHGRLLLDDTEFRSTFEHFSGDNWTSFERKWNLKELLRLTQNVPGDYAECGVYRGGSATLLCAAASRSGREVHLFDSFQGLSEPLATENHHWSAGDLAAPRELLEANLSGYDNYHIHEGWIPAVFPTVSDRRFSFVHVDVDLEQPTRDSISFFFPRLNTGGVLLLDDHGYKQCPGARKAALEYFESRPEPVIDLATGQGLVIKQSP